jgi:hypothetical protein
LTFGSKKQTKNLGKLPLYLQEELQRERDERNYYQMERDRIDTFWEVTRRELGNICIIFH